MVLVVEPVGAATAGEHATTSPGSSIRSVSSVRRVGWPATDHDQLLVGVMDV